MPPKTLRHRRTHARHRPERPGRPVQPWADTVFTPTQGRGYSPCAIALTLCVHLLPLLVLLLAPEWLSPIIEPSATKKPTKVELLPPPFVQVNPFANQARIQTLQEGAQNQRAAQEADPDLESRAEGPQLEGESPDFNRILSGNPEAPDIAPAPPAPAGNADSARAPSATTRSGGVQLQTRAEYLQQQAMAAAQQASPGAAASPVVPPAGITGQSSNPTPEATQFPLPQSLTQADSLSQPTHGETLPVESAEPLPEQITDSPQPPQAEAPEPPAPQQMPTEPEQPADLKQPTEPAQPAPVAPAVEPLPEQTTPEPLPEPTPNSMTQPAPTEHSVEQGTEDTPAIDPALPRPRPQLEPRLSAGPLRHQAVTANRRGMVAIDSRFSEFGAYQQRMIEAISAQWYLLARQSRAIDSEYGTQVVLEFTMDSQGIVNGAKVRFTNASAAATLLCINAVESRSPFGSWTADMQRVLGSKQTVTFTFYYR